VTLRQGRPRRERGAAAVEFGLILPVLLLIIGGIVDFGLMYYKQILLANAARDGVRQVVVNQATGGWTGAQIAGRVQQAANPLQINSPSLKRNGTATTTWYCQVSGDSMTITVTPLTPYDYTILKFVPGLPKPSLTGTATMTCG
jgi:Flp pilus assembly protein TadG